MNGDLPSSYIKECSIHQSFNRAVNIHGTNYVTVERNVIYDIMGGAFFLEDGVEIGNTFSSNLAVFVRSSSSLLNEDLTPGKYAFFVSNKSNLCKIFAIKKLLSGSQIRTTRGSTMQWLVEVTLASGIDCSIDPTVLRLMPIIVPKR
jgi:hypothetical protein